MSGPLGCEASLAYWEAPGEVASILITLTSRIITPVIPVIDLHTSPFDPPSTISLGPDGDQGANHLGSDHQAGKLHTELRLRGSLPWVF